jgi:hypothetical protein
MQKVEATTRREMKLPWFSVSREGDRNRVRKRERKREREREQERERQQETNKRQKREQPPVSPPAPRRNNLYGTAAHRRV